MEIELLPTIRPHGITIASATSSRMVDVAKIACREYILSPSSRKAFRTVLLERNTGVKPITVAPSGNLIQRFESNVSERFNRGGRHLLLKGIVYDMAEIKVYYRILKM